MSDISFINNPFENPFNTIITTFNLTEFRLSNHHTTRAFGGYYKFSSITSIIINNVIKSMLTIRNFVWENGDRPRLN
ncbi:hypothetical protein F475_01159 [Pseudomonas sp. URMO17WK12:I6]|nr:hypothetical protein F475_01159 [Pseudomonas sp. URMO17WK12:I6]